MLWVDAKKVPDLGWVWATTVGCARALIAGGCVEELSLPSRGQRALVAGVLALSGSPGFPARVYRHTRGPFPPPAVLRCRAVP